MAKVVKINPHVADKAKRETAVARFVEQSSAIEGIRIHRRDPRTGRFTKKSA